jgi:hypothetical protein
MRWKWNQLFTYERRDVHGSNQLENNTTKNLLKTLQDIDVEATSELLSKWFPQSEWSISNAEYRFQPDVSQVEKSSENYLLGISRFQYPHSPIWATDDITTETASVADGLITVDADGNRARNIVLEIKTGANKLDESQMARYRQETGIENTERTGVVQWLPLYRQLRNLQYGDTVGKPHNNKNSSSEAANDRAVSELDRESYLLKEFADYLELEQLKPTLAQIGADDSDGATKTFRMFREKDPDGKWPLGSLLFEFEWDEGNSGIGPFHAKAFEHLLMQIGGSGLTEDELPVHAMPEIGETTSHSPHKGRETRQKIFLASEEEGMRDVDADALRSWVDDSETVSSSSGEYFAATRHPDGDYQESNKIKRLRIDSDGFVCLKHFSEDDNHSQAKPHLSRDEFERLFSEIPFDIRAEGIVEPDVTQLWEYVLQGKSHSIPDSVT